jgi:hypothetical protein
MTPIPVASSYEALTAMLSKGCVGRQSNRAGRHRETIGERLVADIAALDDLPAVPLEPCEKRAARVSSTALVRYRANEYSTPTAYGFQEDPLHYLVLIEMKPNALDQAAALQG